MGPGRTRCGPDRSGQAIRRPGDDVIHALAEDDQLDVIDCGAGNDVAWLSQLERGLYRVRDCEVVKIIVPTPAELADEDED